MPGRPAWSRRRVAVALSAAALSVVSKRAGTSSSKRMPFVADNRLPVLMQWAIVLNLWASHWG